MQSQVFDLIIEVLTMYLILIEVLLLPHIVACSALDLKVTVPELQEILPMCRLFSRSLSFRTYIDDGVSAAIIPSRLSVVPCFPCP